jgi:rfaE bifunctional protein kinase chain/domain
MGTIAMTHLQEYLSKERLGEILNRYTERKIGVVGDLGLDAYWYADMTRSFLSRETPHFARPVVREAYSPGAGANVADNLKALGVGQVVVFSVLGDDWRGGILRQEMARRGIVVERLIVSPQRSTTTFIKPMLMGYDSQQEDARLDFENAEPLAPELEETLIDCLSEHVPGLDALLVADQLDVNGTITDRVREALNHLAEDYPEKVFVADSRQRIGLFQHMVLKPNWVEATAAVYPERDPRTVEHHELGEIATILSERSARPTFLTLSADGVLVCAGATCHRVPIPPVCPPLDPVGAGDAFIAGLAASLAVGATPWEAGAVANLAAAVTVEKLNETGTASPAEIRERYALAERAGAP